jgi:gas vesicle protein
MNTEKQQIKKSASHGSAAAMLAGVVVGGLAGASAILLLAPQPGEQTRAELQEGVEHLREQTTEKVKDTVTQVKSKADQIKVDLQTKAGDLQHQGQDLLVRQLDRVSHAAEAGKQALQNSPEHTVV